MGNILFGDAPRSREPYPCTPHTTEHDRRFYEFYEPRWAGTVPARSSAHSQTNTALSKPVWRKGLRDLSNSSGHLPVKEDRLGKKEFNTSAKLVAELESAINRGDAAGIRHALAERHASHLKGLEGRAHERLRSLEQQALARLCSVPKMTEPSTVQSAIRQAKAAGLDGPELDEACLHLEKLTSSTPDAVSCLPCRYSVDPLKKDLIRAADQMDVNKLSILLERAREMEVNPALCSQAEACQQQLWAT